MYIRYGVGVDVYTHGINVAFVRYGILSVIQSAIGPLTLSKQHTSIWMYMYTILKIGQVVCETPLITQLCNTHTHMIPVR